MEGTNDSILTSQVKSKLFRVGRMNPTHMNAPTKNINSMYEHQMSDAHKTVICKKGKLAKNNATRQLIRNTFVTSGLTIKGTVPMRDPGGKKCLHARARFKGVNFSNVFDGTFSSSSSGSISQLIYQSTRDRTTPTTYIIINSQLHKHATTHTQTCS